MLETRILAMKDIPQVVEAWNRSLIYDKVTQERFEWVVLDDPNYEQAGNLIAYYNGKLAGFVSAVAREGITGKHGRDGHIKSLFVLDEYWDAGVGETLLEHAETYLKSKGKCVIKVVIYLGGRYFFPGIDLRYKKLLTLFASMGYERLTDWGEVCTINDLSVNLIDFEPTEYQVDAQKRAANIGVTITDYHPNMLDKMRTFVVGLKHDHWFPPGWERGFGERGDHLVALKEDAIVGWATYWPKYQSFGPIGVLETYRGHGIGTCLLLESTLRMKALGVPEMRAGWALTDFYLRSGWEICRQYAPFQKELQS